MFARMGAPQAVAVISCPAEDTAPGHESHLFLNLQRIPWLDLVDREVRLNKKSMESLVMNGLDPAVRERFFKSNRERRGL